jgi:uncharacterized protein (TIGR02118 family)
MNKRHFLASSFAAAVGAAGYSPVSDAQVATPQGVKLVFMFHRRPGMDFGDFSRYWRDQHAPIGAALPGVRKYVQNHAAAALDGSLPPCDGFSELWFDDVESLQRALTSPEAQAALLDSVNFIDVERIQTFVVEEVSVV